jgi:hypothetical protein
MNKSDLDIAIAEAKRFIETAQKCTVYGNPVTSNSIRPGREAAACKRASMDLTRALANLRHPDRNGGY